MNPYSRASSQSYHLIFDRDEKQCSFEKPSNTEIGQVEYSTVKVDMGDKVHTFKVITSNLEESKIRRICHYIEALNPELRQKFFSNKEGETLWLREVQEFVKEQPSIDNSLKQEVLREEIEDKIKKINATVKGYSLDIRDYLDMERSGRVYRYNTLIPLEQYKYKDDAQSIQEFLDGNDRLNRSEVNRAIIDKNHPSHELVKSARALALEYKGDMINASQMVKIGYYIENECLLETQKAFIFGDKDYISRVIQKMNEKMAEKQALENQIKEMQ